MIACMVVALLQIVNVTGQQVAWEPRIDNGYADVFRIVDDNNKTTWRMYYTTFTTCATDKRDKEGNA